MHLSIACSLARLSTIDRLSRLRHYELLLGAGEAGRRSDNPGRLIIENVLRHTRLHVRLYSLRLVNRMQDVLVQELLDERRVLAALLVVWTVLLLLER